MAPPCYTTLLIGTHALFVPNFGDLNQIVRVFREEAANRYFISNLETIFPTLEAAKEEVERWEGKIEWRPEVAATSGEIACAVCGAWLGEFLEAKERHPNRLCSVCILEAVDAHGRSVRFGNTGPMGTGFEGIVIDTGEKHTSRICYVRGHTCRADEARFGGIVIEVAAY